MCSIFFLQNHSTLLCITWVLSPTNQCIHTVPEFLSQLYCTLSFCPQWYLCCWCWHHRPDWTHCRPLLWSADSASCWTRSVWRICCCWPPPACSADSSASGSWSPWSSTGPGRSQPGPGSQGPGSCLMTAWHWPSWRISSSAPQISSFSLRIYCSFGPIASFSCLDCWHPWEPLGGFSQQPSFSSVLFPVQNHLEDMKIFHIYKTQQHVYTVFIL